MEWEEKGLEVGCEAGWEGLGIAWEGLREERRRDWKRIGSGEGEVGLENREDKGWKGRGRDWGRRGDTVGGTEGGRGRLGRSAGEREGGVIDMP